MSNCVLNTIRLKYRQNRGEVDLPESSMLALARCGGAPKPQPGESDFKQLVSIINSGEPRIVFPWFWQHDAVKLFRDLYAAQIHQDGLAKALQQCMEIVDPTSSHWIERVNLFHLFGVSRLFDAVEREVQQLQDNGRYWKGGLVSVSASNANLLARCADSKDAKYVINAMESEGLVRLFAEYQLYYYKGLSNLVETMESYVGTSKEVIIPTALSAIMRTYDIGLPGSVEIYDRVLSKLPFQARALVPFDQGVTK